MSGLRLACAILLVLFTGLLGMILHEQVETPEGAFWILILVVIIAGLIVGVVRNDEGD